MMKNDNFHHVTFEIEQSTSSLGYLNKETTLIHVAADVSKFSDKGAVSGV